MYRSNYVAALLILFAVLFAMPEGSRDQSDSASQADNHSLNGLAAPLAGEAAVPPVVNPRTIELLGTDAPGRDLISLTQRLRLKNNTPIPEVVNSVPPDYKAG